MKSPSKRQIVYGLVVLLILGGSCCRVFVCFHFNPTNYLFSDPLRHWTNGMLFPKGGYLGASDPIGFQAYVFVLQRITANNRILVALASALLSVLMPWTYYRAARNFGLQKVPSLWVWALIVWTPSLLAIYHYMMMETLLLLLEGLALWATARHLRRGGNRAFVLSVIVWTLAVLTKPSVLPLAGICILWSCWTRRPSLRAISAAAATVFVLLLPQAIRSEVVLGFIAPLGNPWLTTIQHRSDVAAIEVHFISHASKYARFKADGRGDLRFSSPAVVAKPLWPLSNWSARRGASLVVLVMTVDLAYGTRDWKETYEKFSPDRRRWWRLLGENIVFFLFSPSWPESDSTQWIDKWEFPARWMWAPIVLFVLAGNVRGFVQRKFDLLPMAVTLFALFLALQNVVTFEGRYRKPLEPLLLLNLVWIIATSFNGQEQLQEEAVPVAVGNQSPHRPATK